MKDVILILLAALLAYGLAMLLQVLLWLSNALVFVGFLAFCWWYTRLPQYERVELWNRLAGLWRFFRTMIAR